MRRLLSCFIFVFLLGLMGCDSDIVVYAPVVDVATIDHIPKNGIHRVSTGETLYSIAWRYGLDYRYVALRNAIQPPYHIEAGQLIYLRGRPSVSPRLPTQPGKTTVNPHITIEQQEINTPVRGWRWPARGPVLNAFSYLNKGINIGGQMGAPIYATAWGQVVYCGSGLRGYGNLIIIKHNSTFLTAYAHNSAVLVKEGDWVKSGQQIAQMGNTGSPRVMLHFEIRRNGKPVNPLGYLS